MDSDLKYPEKPIPCFLSLFVNCAVRSSGAYSSRSFFVHGTMVVILQLDDDDTFDPYGRPKALALLQKPYPQENISYLSSSDSSDGNSIVNQEAERPNPNINGFSAALGCYP